MKLKIETVKMIPRPQISPDWAWKLLHDNNCEDLELADGCSIALEPNCPPEMDYMLCFVPNGNWLETYGVHTGGKRWTWVT